MHTIRINFRTPWTLKLTAKIQEKLIKQSIDDNRVETVALTRPDVAIGHCAALERDGEHVNLRPVSAVHCDAPDGDEESPGEEHRETAAEKCSAARAALASPAAGTDISAALRKMRAYCE